MQKVVLSGAIAGAVVLIIVLEIVASQFDVLALALILWMA